MNVRAFTAGCAVAPALAHPAAAQEGEALQSPRAPDDRLGAANRMTPQAIADAARLVTGDKMYSPGVIVDEETPAFPPHQIPGAENGVCIPKNMDTRALAADDASEFLFVLGHPRIRGTAQMIINPIAIR